MTIADKVWPNLQNWKLISTLPSSINWFGLIQLEFQEILMEMVWFDTARISRNIMVSEWKRLYSMSFIIKCEWDKISEICGLLQCRIWNICFMRWDLCPIFVS